MIDGEGVVQNGPFRTCECSGNIFFGEDRVECLSEQSHIAGDVVVFCIWNEMLEIRAIDQVFVKLNQNRTYQLIEDGIPDIHTQSYLQTRAAVVSTVLDPVWFLETSTILGLQVKLQAEAKFQTTDEYDMPHLLDVQRNSYHGLRQMTEPEPEQEPNPYLLFINFIYFTFWAFVIAFHYWFCVKDCEGSQWRREEHQESVRRTEQRYVRKQPIDRGEPQNATIDHSKPDDHISTTA
ncbi:hypothetical protein FisN_7Hu221 [Fistulifera solaris]|uniref:Uncharacterized protein n=1 Tax=Fistulifera solaris TaxID=1519565 RepID=A0A1Z5K3S7_FISSO|nr:hypothetical protein FisN_7Hu221 [Fistulifera solaris]|eukprot:GAX20900.1 hypothetical protein FisN_7Hu221 [Fistulifera solaris]